MCGIVGIQTGEQPDPGLTISHMMDQIRHRGPDDRGEWFNDSWQLGMVRLAIMDPQHGRQPMHSADGHWVVVFNGEIYNFRALRERLLAEGAVFQTRSDTEVLTESVARRGVRATLAEIEGMFAFAALDRRRNELWLARDRFGEKPLYIDRRAGRFAFCSELRPLVMATGTSCIPSGRGIAAILRHGYPWPGTTAVEGITELPSEWLCRTASGEESRGFYWQPPDRVDEQAGPEERCAKKLLELLQDSVEARLVADVPLGLFLSGGLDSSTVAALARRRRPDISAVTIGFDSQGYDETPLARMTARQLGIHLLEERGSTESFSVASFDLLLDHFGQPFVDTSAVPTRVVSRAARRHFKVVLSGDGGDELLSGYLSHSRYARLARWGGGRVGGTVSRLLAQIMPAGPRAEGLRRALELNASLPQGLLLHAMDGVFTDDMLMRLFQGTTWEADARLHLEQARAEAVQLWRSTRDSNLALSLHQLRTSLPQAILAKVDRMSMAESLEVRAPMLDSKFARYALSLPAHLKINGSVGKLLLRKALVGVLPDPVLSGRKRGFSLPVRDWLGESFWQELAKEVHLYARDSTAELNVPALRRQIEVDTAWCRRANSFRALHRLVLFYGFLRWRRRLPQIRSQAERALVENLS